MVDLNYVTYFVLFEKSPLKSYPILTNVIEVII